MTTKVMKFPKTAEKVVKVISNFTLEKREIQENHKEKNILCCKNAKKILLYNAEKAIKRLFDLIVGIVGLFVIIPLTIIVYIANLVYGDRGTIFYTQERIGKDGKIFKMLKYRSMVVDAKNELEKHLKENEEARLEYKKYKKLKNDPRITKIGKILRKTSLDEIPQLLHLIDGSMSLVGARPYLPEEKEDMGVYYNVIIKSKPGITGLWQTSGRANTTFEERLDMDVIYVSNRSLAMDIKILFKTVISVLKEEGAV